MTHSTRPGRTRRHRPKRPLGVRLGFIGFMTLAGAGVWYTANIASDMVEARAVANVSAALAEAGHDWTHVNASGLKVILSGTAPSEVDRMRAAIAAAGVVQPSRISDAMMVASTASLPPPAFAAELLANDGGISLIGLVPASTDRKAAIAQLSKTGPQEVSDLLTTTDHTAPESWDTAFSFGLQAVAIAPRAKISIGIGTVSVSAIAESPQDKLRIERTLMGIRPVSVALDMDITAPLPVINPFMLRFVIDDGGSRFEACTAESDTDREAILTAAGIRTECRLGLGAPSGDWAAVAGRSIKAVSELGEGSVGISNFSVTLQAPASTSQEDFDRIASTLEADLPAPFRLTAFRDTDQEAPASAIEFTAAKKPSAPEVSLGGRITNEQMREAVESLARARLGDISSGLVTDEDTPSGWTVRVVAGIEAMSLLSSGGVSVTPDNIRVEGISGDKDASNHIAALLASRLGDGARYSIKVAYDRRQDRMLALPDAATCVARLNGVFDAAEISFAPSSANFAGDVGGIIASLADAMDECEVYRIEIGGHTDSQGSEAFNQKLSEDRAKAVLAAMQEAGIETGLMTARGYGESQPVASNDTEEGREQNRRIEMHALSPEPVLAEALPDADLVTGVTAGTGNDADTAARMPLSGNNTAGEGNAEVSPDTDGGYSLDEAEGSQPDRPSQPAPE